MLFYQIIPENAGLCNEILAQLFYFADKVTIIWKYIPAKYSPTWPSEIFMFKDTGIINVTIKTIETLFMKWVYQSFFF